MRSRTESCFEVFAPLAPRVNLAKMNTLSVHCREDDQTAIASDTDAKKI